MIFSAFERTVAWRYLGSRRKERFVSVIAGFSFAGIMLGVATLIIVMSVMNGFRAELLDRVMGVNAHLVVSAYGRPLDDTYPDLRSRLAAVPGVTYAEPMVEGQAMATGAGDQTSGVVVRGLSGPAIHERTILASNIVKGSLDRFGSTGDEVVIGYRLASKLGLGVGSKLRLISPKGNISPFGTVPRTKTFEVAAIFNVGMFEYDSGFVYIPLTTAQRLFGTGAGVSAIEIMLADPHDLERARTAVRAVLPGGAFYQVNDWQTANAAFVQALQVERNVMFLILSLIIMVAAFNIISSMIMLVKDKGRDIAILRAMGATRGMVMRIFFLNGASIGVSGTLAGFVLGLAFAENINTIKGWLEHFTGGELFSAEIYFLSQLPAKVESFEVLLVVLMGIGLSILATLYPSWRAGRLQPAEALRYE
ncbi:MAG: lipoprotein-releasing ABC transporter permease subunit [Alphaproteobacteria bacterium]|nr:lipoprotein-releasing ABC transporter permease subunit [Alphaproteobacteria bacterium]MCB9929854.1 lipoprotein-releasing ABC transporter permease subunit [Alphaproteobacteria bacterium]